MPTQETTTKLNQLQAEFDRVSAHRARVMKYADSYPDGHPKRAQGLADYEKLSKRWHALERQLGEAADQWIAEDTAEHALPTYSVAHTTDERGEDRWFVEDESADWVEGPYATREMAAEVAAVLVRQAARSAS